MDDDKVWAVRLEGRDVQVRDLPIATLERIAKKYSIQPWLTLVYAPLTDGDAAIELIAAAAEQLDVKPPEVVTGRSALAIFVQVDDDLPTLFEDGVPDPPVEADTL